MKAKIEKFKCSRCEQPVYKLGKKVDEKNKLCGKCRGKWKAVRRKKATAETFLPVKANLPTTDNLDFERTQEYFDGRIAFYGKVIVEAKQLKQQNPNWTFFDAWTAARTNVNRREANEV